MYLFILFCLQIKKKQSEWYNNDSQSEIPWSHRSWKQWQWRRWRVLIDSFARVKWSWLGDYRVRGYRKQPKRTFVFSLKICASKQLCLVEYRNYFIHSTCMIFVWPFVEKVGASTVVDIPCSVCIRTKKQYVCYTI